MKTWLALAFIGTVELTALSGPTSIDESSQACTSQAQLSAAASRPIRLGLPEDFSSSAKPPVRVCPLDAPLYLNTKRGQDKLTHHTTHHAIQSWRFDWRFWISQQTRSFYRVHGCDDPPVSVC